MLYVIVHESLLLVVICFKFSKFTIAFHYVIIIISVTVLFRQGWWSYVVARFIILSVICSVIQSVNRITHKRDNGRQPNMVGMGKG